MDRTRGARFAVGLLVALAVVGSWWRRHPSACPYGLRLSLPAHGPVREPQTAGRGLRSALRAPKWRTTRVLRPFHRLERLAAMLGRTATWQDERLLRRPEKEDSRGRREGDAQDRSRQDLRRERLLRQALRGHLPRGEVAGPEEASRLQTETRRTCEEAVREPPRGAPGRHAAGQARSTASDPPRPTRRPCPPPRAGVPRRHRRTLRSVRTG